VVLGHREELYLVSVGQSQNRDFFALEEGFDHHGTSRLAELTAFQHCPDSFPRFGAAGAHHRTFASGEARGLYHQRLGMLVDVPERRTEVCEGPAGGRRDPSREHDLLRECLGRLQLGGGCARTEHEPSFGP
jgi:hypothetical protein